MVWYTSEDRITLDELADFFDLVPDEELLTFLTSQKRDGTLITVKDKFKAHFFGLESRYLKGQENIAQAKFMTIFEDAILDVMKIKKYQEQIHKDLQNFELYQDEVTTQYTGSSDSSNTGQNSMNQTVANERDLIEGSLTGTSSAASMVASRDQTQKAIETKNILMKSEKKLLDYLDPNTKDVSQVVTLQGGSDKSTLEQSFSTSGTSNANNRGNSKTASSNPFKDRVEFLRLKIPKLTAMFFENFRVMFLC